MILENSNTLQKEPSLHDGYTDKALFIFSKENLIRRKCFRFLQSKIYDFWITFFVILANLALILETYIYQVDVGDDKHTHLVVMFDIFFCSLFSCEILIKLIAYGLVMKNKSFLRNFWNILDTLIIFSYFIDMFYFQFHIETMDIFSVKKKKKKKHINKF